MKNLKLIFVLLLTSSLTVSVFAEYADETRELFKKGLDAVREGDFQNALSYFDQVIEKDPKNTDALANKAGMLIQLQRFEEANSVLDKTLALDSDHLGALNNKGSVLYKLGNFEESIIYFDKVLENSPNNVYALTIKSEALINLERIDEADQSIDKALSINPNHILSLSLKSDILVKKGEPHKAFEYLKTIAKIHPDLAGKLTQSEEFDIRWHRVPGLVEIKINDSAGGLVGYLQTKNIRLLEHEIANNLLDKWENRGEIVLHGTKFEVLHYENTNLISEQNVPGRTGFGISTQQDEDISEGLEHQLWIMLTVHPQYIVEEGDSITVSYTVLRPKV